MAERKTAYFLPLNLYFMQLQKFHKLRNYFFDELVKANIIKDTDKNFIFIENLLSQLFKIKEY